MNNASTPPTESFLTRLRLLKRINAELNNLEAISGQSVLQSTPTHLEVDFTSKCNLRCPMCHQSKLKMGNFRLSDDALHSLIDALPYVETVMLAGLGEPLLFAGLDHFLTFAARYDCHVHLFTNGELIDRHLDTLALIQRVSVSFDGASAEVFEYLRRGARFAHVVENLQQLRARARQTRIVTSTVVSRRNLNEVAAIVALAIELGLDEVHLSPVDHTPELMLGPEHQVEFNNQIERANAQAASSTLRIHNNIGPQHFRIQRNSKISAQDQGLANNWSQAQARDVVRNSERFAETPPLQHHIHALDAAAESAEIEARIARIEHRLLMLKSALKHANTPLQMPYCSAPWKYGFARATGQARLCPYADIDVGAVGLTLSGNYNSKLLCAVRTGFAETKPLLSVCQSCTDDHRHFRSDALKRTLMEMSD